MSNVRILIIEDESVIAQDICDIITDLGYESAGIIHNAEKAIDYLSFHTPDLILCDIRIQGTESGIEVMQKALRTKKIPHIYLTSFSDPSTLDRAKRTMPYGYIVKPFNDRDLHTAIEIALFRFRQEMDALALTKEKLNALTNSPLTVQEFQIIQQMIQGMTNDSMSTALNISNNTVKFHIKNILQKFEASHRGDIMQKILMKWVINEGLE